MPANISRKKHISANIQVHISWILWAHRPWTKKKLIWSWWWSAPWSPAMRQWYNNKIVDFLRCKWVEVGTVPQLELKMEVIGVTCWAGGELVCCAFPFSSMTWLYLSLPLCSNLLLTLLLTLGYFTIFQTAGKQRWCQLLLPSFCRIKSKQRGYSLWTRQPIKVVK